MFNFVLWFDVGNGRYTTRRPLTARRNRLWFDVGNGRYTTQQRQHDQSP